MKHNLLDPKSHAIAILQNCVHSILFHGGHGREAEAVRMLQNAMLHLGYDLR